MIGLFPESYPDELLFSICSRYRDRLGYSGRESTGRDLLGSGTRLIAVDLPGNLKRLCASLNPNYCYTIDRLLHQNTLYPLYSAFLPIERAASLRTAMIDSKACVAHTLAGVLTCKVVVPYLRFCTACVDQDRRTFGETYWHRIHNTPSAEVCTVHSVFLENSWVPTRERSARQTYVTAEKTVRAHPVRQLDSTHESLAKLTLDLEWLLNQRNLHCDPSLSSQRYCDLLIKQGFAPNRSIHHTKLQKAFLEFYSPELLAFLKCGLELRHNWLKRLLQKTRRHSAQSAIHHLLLLNFLGCPIENFFSLPTTEFKPFGNGPWPCLNVASHHLKELTISTCKISWTRNTLSIPVGTFTCRCGFSYRREGPDLNNRSRYQFTRVTSYGEDWFALLRSMNEGGFSQSKIGSRLGVSPDVIRIHLKRLRSKKNPAVMWQGQRSLAMTANLERRDKYRLQWLQRIKQQPEASRAKLRNMVGKGIYTHLMTYDREWFELNTPPPRQQSGPQPRKDWKLQDSDLCLKARVMATLMIENPGRPVRASSTAIARALGILEIIHKRSHLLPLTIAAISDVAESLEDYAIRRILYTADCYKNERINARPHQLQTRAAVSNRMWRNPNVQEVVANVMLSFSNV